MHANPTIPAAVVAESRLAALDGYAVLDTESEAGFDDAVRLASRLCRTPVALVSLVGRDRQWFKARIGFPTCETDLNSSVCAYALVERDLLVIPDLTRDPRTARNPLVTGEPSIRFYAGAPLRNAAGEVLGSLCVIDTEPRPEGLSREQADDLRALGRQVMSLLELRVGETRLKASEAHWRGLFERLSEGFFVGEAIRAPDGRIADWRHLSLNPAWGDLVGIDPAFATGRTAREMFPGIEETWIEDIARVIETGEAVTFTRRLGSRGHWYEGRTFPIDGDRFAASFLEVTARVETEARRAALLAIGDGLRDLDTVSEMTRTASEIVGLTLGADRAGFGRIDERTEFIDIELDWAAEGIASIAGRHRFDDYGDLRATLLRGDPLVIEDVTTDPRTRADSSALHALDIGALVNMPVRQHGRAVAMFIVHSRAPRSWSPDVLAFLRNVADRVELGVARIHAQEHQRVLNGELSHRLKNTLAMVQAIATQTLRPVAERAPVAAFEQRILALGTAHDVLLHQNWAAAPIRAVVEASLATFGHAARFGVSGPDVPLGPRATMSLSLLLHELGTNAVKYGALSNETGRIVIAWRREGHGEGGSLVLRWEESGGPATSEPVRKGFGSRLVGMGLVGTGGVTLRYPVTGFTAEMSAPLSELRQS